MNVDEFLHYGGTDITSVISEIKKKVGINENDELLAVGSLVEGLGNKKSDLDILLVTEKNAHLLPEQSEDIGLICGRCLVNLRVLRVAEIKELLARLDKWSSQPWNVTKLASFTNDDRVFLHRLLHSKTFSDNPADKSILEIKPPAENLARLKLHFARQISRTIQVDMVGYRDEGDYSSLVFAAQDILDHAADALLAGHLLTNPNAKWRSRLLKQLPSDWSSQLILRPVELPADELIWKLHRAPQRAEAALCIEYASRILAFARAIFVWAESKLVRPACERLVIKNWHQSKSQPDDFSLPNLEFDVDFSITQDEEVAVARLNEFSKPIKLSSREFSIALLFDGITTLREAESVTFGQGENLSEREISKVIFQVVQAGLDYSPRDEEGLL